jgi:hypothetical protein
MRRGLLLVLLTITIINLAAVGALAAPAESGPRRIDTANIVKSTDVKELGAADKSAAKIGETAKKGETAKAGHPAWMVPGWQAVFALLAVGYFALAVTVLPRFVAKEEHH